MAYSFSARADRDLLEIYRHGSRAFGEAQAERYLASLHTTFALLAGRPHINRERKSFSPPVRLHPSPPHIIAYRQQGADILIIRILHTRQNWHNHL